MIFLALEGGGTLDCYSILAASTNKRKKFSYIIWQEYWCDGQG